LLFLRINPININLKGINMKEQDLDNKVHLARNFKGSEDKIFKNYSKELTPNMLKNLSTSINFYTRRRVAQHPKTSPEVLKTLGTDKVWVVREGVVCNPRTPNNVLIFIFEKEREQPHKDLILALIKNKNLPEFVYQCIASLWPELI